MNMLKFIPHFKKEDVYWMVRGLRASGKKIEPYNKTIVDIALYDPQMIIDGLEKLWPEKNGPYVYATPIIKKLRKLIAEHTAEKSD